FLAGSAPHRALHSFPTRRSSDLWCFALFVQVGRGTPNPTMPPTALVTVGPYRWTRNPIALSHAAALFGLSLLLGSVSAVAIVVRSEEHTSELQSRENLVCRLLLE